MYRLLFVDDESIIREGISSCISWDSLGFELVSMLENGQQAIEYVRTNPVDIIISDIKMPKIDGLELSRLVSGEFPQTMILLLTGYDDFEYAQEAVRYNVSEFLLKPITARELTEVLVQVKKKLDEQKQTIDEQRELKEKLERSFPLLRERFLYRMISGKLDTASIEERRGYFQWTDLEGLYQIVVVDIPPTWDDLARITLYEHLRKLLDSSDEIISNRDENLVLLLQQSADAVTKCAYDSVLTLEQRGELLAKRAFSFIASCHDDPVSIGCGEVVDDLGLVVVSYRGACNAVDYLRVLGHSKIMHISEIRDKKTISPEGFNLLSHNLLEQLKGGSRRATEQALEAIFTYFEKHYLTLHEASFYLVRLQSQLLDFLQEMDLIRPEDEHLPLKTEFFVSINQARGFFTKMVQRIEERILEKRNDLTSSRIDKAKAIIANRYSDKDFSLKDICDELFLSTSQFSLLFKEGTGKTFVEYLTAYRIEEARMLLKSTSMRGYEIADRVGFADPRYFSIIFKKLTGMTPMEYRRSLES